MAKNQPNTVSSEELSAAYSKVAFLEEKLSETQESVKVKLNELEALRAYYLRRSQDLEKCTQQTIELLRDEWKVASMVKERGGSGEQSELEAFAERTEALVSQVAEQLNKEA
ncbi:hypothetical protein IWX49DRAFT_551839 [Phyllosticta citricarpa]